MNLRTFRKDGLPIDTPVWVVAFDDGVAFYTDDRSFKYKRMRRNPRVEVAPSDVWGKLPEGAEWRPGTARYVDDPARQQRLYDALAHKYGIHWKLVKLGRTLVNTLKNRAVFEIILDRPERADALSAIGPALGSAG
jgi:PPOX class probable F420-dependent enzyme